MNDVHTKLEKAHTQEYIQLKRVAEDLDKIWVKAQKHTPHTVNSVRSTLNARWDEAVTKLIAEGSQPGTINAARRRLSASKQLLSFLYE